MEWTQEKLELLKHRWTVERKSGTQIGDEFGVTRNAIMGKVNILGIQRRDPKPIKRPKPAPKTHRKKLLIPRIKLDLPPPPPEKPLFIPFMELKPKHCRYPLEAERPYTFCGCEKRRGSSYCEMHWDRTTTERGKASGKPIAWYTPKF